MSPTAPPARDEPAGRSTTSPRAGEVRPGGRSARVRAAVLAATIELLGEVGYGAVAVDDVAARAGVHKTTVYRRWPSKAALVADALATAGAERVPLHETGDLRADLRALAAAVAAQLRDPARGSVAAGLVAEAASSAEVAELGHRFIGERLEQADGLVERAVARGELPAGTRARTMVEAIVGPLWFRHLVTGEPVDRATAHRFADLALDGARRVDPAGQMLSSSSSMASSR